MMSRHFALSSEPSGPIAKRLPHANNQLSAPGSFFNQFVYIYIRIQSSNPISVSQMMVKIVYIQFVHYIP